MIPVLFPADATTWTSNGLGGLSDAVSCLVRETRNGEYELEMIYPVTGIHYSDIAISCLILAKPSDGADPEPFRIYKITRPIDGQVTINAEHISYQLNMIPVLPFTAASCLLALEGLKTNAAESCPFNFYTDKVISTQWQNKTPASIRERLGGSDGSILEAFKGEFEFNGYDVHLWTNRGSNNGVVIRYGKNLTDLKQEQSIADTYTGICPYWQKENEDGTVTTVMLTEHVLHSARASNFPYQRTIVVDFSDQWEEPPTEQELRDAGNAYILANDIGIPSVNLTVDFVALWQTEEYASLSALERIKLCDTITVRFDRLGVNATAKVIKTEYNTLLERYNKLEIGDARGNLAHEISEISSDTTQQAVKSVTAAYTHAIGQATDLISGGLGGHVVINTNADGQPNEILIMDTEDVSTAVNVIRLNENGIGFSTNGYNGPFASAWTIDNKFNAQLIDVLNLSANSINAGILRDATGNNYWNLDTGELVLRDMTDAISSIETQINNQQTERLKYIRLVNGTIYLGEEGNDLMLTLTNDRLSFTQNGQEVAYFANNRLYVTTGEFIQSLQVGDFAFIPAQNGSMSFMKVR